MSTETIRTTIRQEDGRNSKFFIIMSIKNLGYFHEIPKFSLFYTLEFKCNTSKKITTLICIEDSLIWEMGEQNVTTQRSITIVLKGIISLSPTRGLRLAEAGLLSRSGPEEDEDPRASWNTFKFTFDNEKFS